MFTENKYFQFILNLENFKTNKILIKLIYVLSHKYFNDILTNIVPKEIKKNKQLWFNHQSQDS